VILGIAADVEGAGFEMKVVDGRKTAFYDYSHGLQLPLKGFWEGLVDACVSINDSPATVNQP
jgi:hypothetical protein